MNKQAQKNKRKFNTRDLLRNSKFLLFISFLLACVFWVVFASTADEESFTVVTDVPVTIELSEQAKNEGLRVYRGGDTKVTVHVKGNRLTVGSITNGDIQVLAQNTSSINVANTYALSLSAKKAGVKTDYEIVSVNPSVINISVDKERQQEFPIAKNINLSEVTFPTNNTSEISGYYVSQPVIAQDKVTVTGPEQEVKKISKVQIADTITGEHRENIVKKLPIQLLDSDGDKIESELLTVTPSEVDVTIQILQEKEIPVVPAFTNIPVGIDIEKIASVTPSTVTIASSENILSALTNITLDPIDFNSLDPTTTQVTRNITLPNGCINLSDEQQAKITFDLKDYTSTVATLSDIQLKNVPIGYSAQVSTKSISISIAGPKEIINEISKEDISATVDLSVLADGFEGSQELPVIIGMSNKLAKKCWCFNSENTVNVSVKKSTLIT
ncbi:MAG: CdaR family protein [Acutalibacteraceae bacterium]|nr:CdaR family protein [Acutalibacteraceae bacterium]